MNGGKFGKTIYRPGPVVYLNLEDDEEELKRRVTAVAMDHSFDMHELGQRLSIHTRDDNEIQPLVVADLYERGLRARA